MKRRSTHFLAALLALASLSTAAVAEDADAPYYDGTWSVRSACQAGTVCPTRIVLTEFDGTWQDLSGRSAAKRACGGRKMPITVQASTREVLAFTAWGDGVSASCPNYTIIVKPVDAKTLAGTVDTEGHGDESPEVHASHSASPDAPRTGDGEALPAPSASARPIRLQKTR